MLGVENVMPNTQVITMVKSKFAEAIEASNDGFYDILTIDKTELYTLCEILKEAGFNYLANLTAVDYTDKFVMVYHIHSIPDNQRIMVKTELEHDNPTVDSVVSIWKTADWQEREVYDLLGINFTNHPNLIRILLPYDFTEHPLRKDFKLK